MSVLEVVQRVKMMDGLNRYRFKQAPELLAAWESVSNVVAAPRSLVPKSGEVPAQDGDVRPATTPDWLPQRPSPVWQTIVGVVGDTRDGGPDAEPRPVVYSALDVTPDGSAGLVIRSDGRAGDLVPSATAIVRRIAPTALVEDVMTIAQHKAETVSPRRLNAVLISSFGMLAIVIAAVGIAGVLAFSVSARTNEIGIRMSLGADGGHVQRMILQEGGALVVVGLALGVIGAFAATGVIRGLLFGVEPHDPVTFAGVVVVMAAVGIVACWIPALRASRIDPAIAMRA